MKLPIISDLIAAYRYRKIQKQLERMTEHMEKVVQRLKQSNPYQGPRMKDGTFFSQTLPHGLLES